ncbi:hypothetical protein CASFOL_039894 [Castilleja foliolosa]|uniref:Uncharacterized protein n=1 Tax=Castilleja foliolosa TaxID=1961234 RepID=A0ABD3BH25_9LAMI
MEVITEAQIDSATSEACAAPPPLMQVMKYMVPSVLALATLEYQGKAKSPFIDNPIPVWCFLSATCVYWLTIGAIEQMQTITRERHIMIISRVALSSGLLSAKSLFLIFIPPPISFLLLSIWIPLLPLLAWPLIKYAYDNNLLGAGFFTNVMDKIRTKVGWVKSGYKEEDESLPV